MERTNERMNGVEEAVGVALERWRGCGMEHPFCIGIGGGSASGKSTLAARLRELLAPLKVEVVGQDRFFKPAAELPPHAWPGREEPWPDYNRPDSFHTEEMFAHCRRVVGAQRREEGVDVVVLEGILVLHYAELRELMDLRLYVAADADGRIVRRIRRNLRAGAELDGICDYYLESVRFQHERFNAPTARHADLVIPGGSPRRRSGRGWWKGCTGGSRME